MKKFKFKRVYLFFFTAWACFIHIPMAFATGRPFLKLKIVDPIITPKVVDTKASSVYKVYDSLKEKISNDFDVINLLPERDRFLYANYLNKISNETLRFNKLY